MMNELIEDDVFDQFIKPAREKLFLMVRMITQTNKRLRNRNRSRKPPVYNKIAAD